MKDKESPMMKQYKMIKQSNPDCLLFFRLGDFYELFNDDAVTASRELDLVLTGKNCGGGERAPMCGVPFHAVDSYIGKLIEKGYKVAICEQTSIPEKGLAKREVIKVVTPGTVMESEMLSPGKNNYLLSVCYENATAGECWADISTLGQMKFLFNLLSSASVCLILSIFCFSCLARQMKLLFSCFHLLLC